MPRLPALPSNGIRLTTIKSSVVSITKIGLESREFGSGFVIHRDEQWTYVLTCRHVVNSIGQDQVEVDGRPATVIEHPLSTAIDLVVLRVNKKLGRVPLKLKSYQVEGLDRVLLRLGGVEPHFVAVGYGLLAPGSPALESKALECKLAEQVEWSVPGQDGRLTLKAWEIEIRDDDSLQKGYSGGPVVDRTSGNVIGVISHREADGRRGRAISIEALARVWEAMPPNLLGEPLNLKPAWPTRFIIGLLVIVGALSALGLLFASGILPLFPTPTPTATPAATLTHSPTSPPPSATLTPTPSRTQTETPIPTETLTPTITLTPTVTASPTRTPSATSTPTPGPIGTPIGLGWPVQSVAFSPDGAWIAVGLSDNTLRLLPTSGEGEAVVLGGNVGVLRSVAFSPDGALIAAGSGDTTVRLWRVANGLLLNTLAGHSGQVYSVAFSPDGKLIASGSGDGTVRVWDVSKGVTLNTLRNHAEEVWTVAFSPDGNGLASGSEDHTISLWRLPEGALIRTLGRGINEADVVYRLAFSPDSRTLAAASKDNLVRIWNVSDGTQPFRLRHNGAVWSVAYAPDGSLIAAGASDGSLRLWRVSDKQLIYDRKGHQAGINALAFSADSRFLVTGSRGDFTVQLWRVK